MKTETTHILDRRAFLSAAAGLALLPLCTREINAQASGGGTPTRPDVAALDRARIFAQAWQALSAAPASLPALPCVRSPGTQNDYYSEAAPADEAKPSAMPFTAHRDALFTLGLQVSALTAAYLLSAEERFAAQASLLLRAWFVDPQTRMTPRLDHAHVASSGSAKPAGTAEGIVETLPLVEIAQALPFLAASASLAAGDRVAIQAWFAEYLRWLTAPEDSGPRLPALARDRKDHHGTSWTLQVAACTLLTAQEERGPKAESAGMADLRHRFRTVTLRAQIAGDGRFPHELSTATPYRDSLFNLDLMACLCELLSTRFENAWEYQLEDGPGMRAAMAYHFPFLADRAKWPFRADVEHFKELPGRRISLLLAAKAYQRPEYAALWKTLLPDPPDLAIRLTMPGQQPLLWVRHAGRSS